MARPDSVLNQIHSTRIVRPDGSVILTRDGYGQLYALACRGAGLTVVHRDGDLPHVDGLAILDMGVFGLPDDAAAHSEFRVWLNSNQRLAFPVHPCARRMWLDRLIGAFFPNACGAPDEDDRFAPGRAGP